MKENYDKNPKVRPLLPVNKGDNVMVRDIQREGYAASSSDNITHHILLRKRAI